MSESNDSVDKKKEEGSTSTLKSIESYSYKFFQFIISIFVVILIILLYFSGGTLVLFICKIAQSNILPSEPNCAPYTDTKPIINPSPIQTNIFTTYTKPEMSMKMEIPYEINSKYKLIEIFKNYKDNSTSNFLANYFISISESILQFNYSMINVLMNTINNTFPESVIIGFGPIFCSFLYSFGILINILYFVYLWFAKMGWFFKTNANNNSYGKPEWKKVGIFSPIYYFLGVALSILFIFLFIICFPIISILPIFIFHDAIISTLFVKGIIKNETVTAFGIIKEALKQYKISLVTIISIFVVLLAFSNLGILSGIIAMIVCAFIYSGSIQMYMFLPFEEKNMSPSVSYKQAVKKCPETIKYYQKHGLLYNLIFGQTGGGDITKQLKKLSKNIDKI